MAFLAADLESIVVDAAVDRALAEEDPAVGVPAGDPGRRLGVGCAADRNAERRDEEE